MCSSILVHIQVSEIGLKLQGSVRLPFLKIGTTAGADPGGSLGSRDPPPEIYQGSQKNDVLV